ncbi:S-layer homology domain-containing protein [Fusibacter sp. 3D3]|uniref:InlB B-repeat-containing protein n=1 Tax=Fusibacter sp. 3D3 TaxID=1048380 RepID=UPI0008530274|nr:S-layer homology domain-containing protein [Fusibacter sp. 3D3]GAU77625.1 Ig-like repeat domain protein 1 [Fusibacter sp. 3D3]
MKKVRKRMSSLLLSICMVFTMLPAVAFAASTTEISAFDTLGEEVALQTVPNGTLQSSLNLPSTLQVELTSGSAYTVDVSVWVSDPVYDGNTAGDYVFRPTLDLLPDVALVGSATPPLITVSVKAVLEVAPSIYTFDSLEEGYGIESYLEAAKPKTFTLTNNGAIDLTEIHLSVMGSSSDWFDLGDLNSTSLNATESAEFTITPKLSLSKGIHSTTIIVISNGTLLASIPVSLTVTEMLPRIRFTHADAYKIDTDFSGTGYSWDAALKTLTLNSDYVAGSIEFLNLDSEAVTLRLAGDVTIDESSNLYNVIDCDSGNLTIDLASHTLTIIGNTALYGDDREITIQNGTLVANQNSDSTGSLIRVQKLVVENATVMVHAGNMGTGIEILRDGSLTLKQGAYIHIHGLLGLLLNSPALLNLESDEITLTVLSSSSAYSSLDLDCNYAPSSTLKIWTNTESAQPSPAGAGILLSSKTDAEWFDLWSNSKYVHLGTVSPKSIVTVTNGTGSGTYSENTAVTITANTAPSGKQFKAWTVVSGGVTLVDAKAASTSFTMPANAVEVTATYEEISTDVFVATAAELKTALEAITSQTVNVTADITFSEKISQGADHTLVIPSGKTVTTSGNLGLINIGSHTLTLNGGGTFVCSSSGNALFSNTGTLNLENINVNVTGNYYGITVKTIHVNSGAAVNLNATSGQQLIRLLDAGYTLNINAGGAIEIIDFSERAIVNYGGTIHINGGSLTIGKGQSDDQIGIWMNRGLLKYSSGTLNVTDDAVIRLIQSALAEGVSGKFIDGGYTLAANGKIIIDAADAAPSVDGLSEGYYHWNSSKNAFEKQMITIEKQPQDVTVTEGAITESLSVTASASSGGAISYRWWDDDLISGAVDATYTLPTHLTAGTYKYYCELTAPGCSHLYTQEVTVTVKPAVTYAVTVNKGTASNATVAEGATVTITANTPDAGKRFKAWTIQSGGIALNNAQASSTSFTMPANAVEITATYEAIPAGVTPVTGIALDKTALSLYSNTSTKTANLIATLTPADATDKSVTWLSSETAVATVDASGLVTAVGNGTTTISVTTIDGGYTASCSLTVQTYTSGGSSSDDDGGSSSSGGSSSGGGLPSGDSTASGSSGASGGITLKENQPNQPVTAVSSVTATAGTNGVASASIADTAVAEAISKAQAEATKQAKTEEGISIGLNVTMPQGTKALTATLSQNALGRLVSAGVTKLELSGSPVAVSFDQKALAEIQKQVSGNVSITITPQTGLSETAMALIGTRPIYNITVSYGDNSSVSSFGEGSATIAIPYTPANGEAISGLYAVYVDENGLTTRVEGSSYDTSSGSILFTTPHFSLYGIAYTAPSEKLKDIDHHWGKASIAHVVDLEILPGIAETTFAPDTATAREMLVTALGKLVKVDVSRYTTSSFTDVKVGSTYQPYIEWAYKSAIIHGIGNSEFAPNRAITREEIAVIIANFTKATGYTLPAGGEAVPYADASSIGEPYKAAVTAMQKADIMTGGTDNQFSPKSSATRAEVASILHRFLKQIID